MYRESKEIIYSDIPLSFTAHPVNGNVILVKNSESIKQSVKNIVLTNFHERPYNIFFGGNLIAQLVENLDSSYTKFLKYCQKNNIQLSENSKKMALIIYFNKNI